MSSFTDPLITEYMDNGNSKLSRSFAYWTGEFENEGLKIRVPEEFETDFASVPWPASMLIPKHGAYNQAAVLHDYLYSVLGYFKCEHTGHEIQYSRKQCDDEFLQAMRVLGVIYWKRTVMYRAVRMFGWVAWEKIKTHKAMKLNSVLFCLIVFLSGCTYISSHEATVLAKDINYPVKMEHIKGDATVKFKFTRKNIIFK